MQNASVRTSRYAKATSTQLLQDILAFNQQEQSPMTFAERYINLAESANHLSETITGNYPPEFEERLISTFEGEIHQVTNQMLDLIEAQMLMGIHYLQWAQYETSHGKRGIGLTLKEEALERVEITRNMQTLLAAIDKQDPVAVFLARECPPPTMTLYRALIQYAEDASREYPLNPWGKCLLGQALLMYKNKAKRQEASECFLHAVLLLPSCSSRAQKVILLKSVLRYCSL
jgi:hypothetical protein